jgi:hypothetical protein
LAPVDEDVARVRLGEEMAESVRRVQRAHAENRARVDQLTRRHGTTTPTDSMTSLSWMTHRCQPVSQSATYNGDGAYDDTPAQRRDGTCQPV